MMRRGLAAAGFCLLSAAAQAADLKIVEIKASLYLEATGKFSDPLTADATLENLAKGDGPDHQLASAVLIELTFSGEKNAAPKFATATVDVTQTNHAGQASVTHKGYTHFVFGPDGLEHKAFLLEDATCGALQVDVHANKTAKTLRLPFHCAAEATKPAR
jgi:hypothetical protein